MTNSIRKAFEDAGVIPASEGRPRDNENENKKEDKAKPGDGIRDAFVRAGLVPSENKNGDGAT